MRDYTSSTHHYAPPIRISVHSIAAAHAVERQADFAEKRGAGGAKYVESLVWKQTESKAGVSIACLSPAQHRWAGDGNCLCSGDHQPRSAGSLR